MAIIHKKNTDIRKDKNITSLLERMPDDEIKNSFTNEQLENLKIAVGARDWKTHAVDIRFTIPLFNKRFYVVFIAGKSIRSSRLQRAIIRKTEAIFISIFFFSMFLITAFILYLIKSAIGINIFSGYSFGVWDWFKGLF
jgi:hypothetical protein